ncbi:MAG: TerB family tellurite resistance protein [Thermodesulfobacteriota bacterium]
MINLVKKFFSNHASAGPDQKKKEEPHDIRVATCALLLEMANIDGEFSKEEQEKIISMLKKDFQLSDEYIPKLIESSHKKLKESIDLWQFTNLINQNYSSDEKIRIIEMIWKVVYTDKRLDKHEDYLVHKLAKLLRLSHKELIDAKLKVLRGSEGE